MSRNRYIDPKLPQKVRAQVLAFWGTSHCFYCTAPLGPRVPATKLVRSSPTVDHVKAVSRGGEDCLSNLVVACWACNATKSGMSPMSWFSDHATNDNYRGY